MTLSLRAKMSSGLSEGDAPPVGGFRKLSPNVALSAAYYLGANQNGRFNWVIDGDIIRARKKFHSGFELPITYIIPQSDKLEVEADLYHQSYSIIYFRTTLEGSSI